MKEDPKIPVRVSALACCTALVLYGTVPGLTLAFVRNQSSNLENLPGISSHQLLLYTAFDIMKIAAAVALIANNQTCIGLSGYLALTAVEILALRFGMAE